MGGRRNKPRWARVLECLPNHSTRFLQDREFTDWQALADFFDGFLEVAA